MHVWITNQIKKRLKVETKKLPKIPQIKLDAYMCALQMRGSPLKKIYIGYIYSPNTILLNIIATFAVQ